MVLAQMGQADFTRNPARTMCVNAHSVLPE